ncbi:hypothetical protein AU510_09615 [Lonsdalea britannica]|uniref:DUF2938 domain-containing protein n=1 Tax=Lonsdalea britannica TaxID=1082704 RepID=UPI000A1DE4F6|nr:DUF2938 domain-containing protein [Lonsdalea britannica]OSN05358.1 hypothetical protein AU510_09615 [Lonsdalea britannica]
MDRVIAVQTVMTGIGATLVMDLWSLFQKHIIGVPSLNYALVGRWVLWMPRGKFWHNTIISTASVRRERLAGWGLHYLTGILFAFIPLLITGPIWSYEPFFFTALLTGLFTLVAPFMILQPALGFGIAASRTPHPWRARLLSVLTHLAYGVGLYMAALVIKS